MTEYTLSTTILPAGMLTMKLISEYSTLIVPTFPSLSPNGDLSEMADLLPGVVQFESQGFVYKEDYQADHPEGFWRYVLGGETQIKMLLDEGNGSTVYFWGRVEPNISGIQQTSLTVNLATDVYPKQSGTFVCVSMATTLKTLDRGTLVTYLLTIDTEGDVWGYPGVFFIKVRGILAALLYQSGLNSSYDITDVNVTGATDFRFFVTSWPSDTWVFNDLWVITSNVTTNANAIPEGNGFDIMNAILRDYCLIPRVYYDLSSSRWKMELVSRGGSYLADPATITSPVSSVLIIKSNPILDALEVREAGAIQNAYFAKRGNTLGNGATYWNIDPGGIELGYSLTMAYKGFNNIPDVQTYYTYIVKNTRYIFTDKTTFYDYSVGGWDATKRQWFESHALFMFYRFSPDSISFERTYSKISATRGGVTSHDNLHVGRVIQDNDGVVVRNLFAIEVRKNIMENSATIRWVEV